MSRPKLLDLYCGAGGAAVGYHRAGFEVVGVDINPQPRYPFEFHQTNALEYDLSGYDFIHASPPCQKFSRMTDSRPGLSEKYPDLIDATRQHITKVEKPWIIENVVGAPLLWPVTLCGSMFGLPLYRHRLFETGALWWPWLKRSIPTHQKHAIPASRAGHWVPGTIISVAGHFAPMSLAKEAMGIDWMNAAEMAEAIPPAFTEFIGGLFLSRRE